MNPNRLPISLVIPLLNEEVDLPAFLTHLEALWPQPQEVILVDSGSKDQTVRLISQWQSLMGEKHDWTITVLTLQQSYPGSSRNAGVNVGTQKYVAFLDCGLKFSPDWLEKVYQQIDHSAVPVVLGNCQFAAQGFWAQIHCCLTYGIGSSHPTIPGSIMLRQYAVANPFREDLRAGEDRVWKMQRPLADWMASDDGLILYDGFYTQLKGILNKRLIYSYFDARSGLLAKSDWIVLGVLTSFCFLLVLSRTWAFLFIAGYILARYYQILLKRSVTVEVLQLQMSTLATLLVLVPLYDLTKAFGLCAGFFKARLRQRTSS